MKMKAQTLVWLFFLALMKNCSCKILFTLEDRHLTATEGSCIEFTCRVTSSVSDAGAYWFWIKNPQWIITNLTGTVIYSTDISARPVSPDFTDRVKYIGSLSSSWNYYRPSPLCSILICDLKVTDSGKYAFRFQGTERWLTEPGISLTVTENLCPLTFEKPPVANESETITLTCSTSTSCPSNLQIQESAQMSSSEPQQGLKKQTYTKKEFKVNWLDHGKKFSCQTQGNKDKYLVQNVNLTVEYRPKDVLAEISSGVVVERQSVTLTCSAKGRPDPTYTWIHNRTVLTTEPVWSITSIEESQNGEYHCEAHNKHGTNISNTLSVIVTYKPEVEVISSDSVFKQGNKMTLTCKVKRSNPQPNHYSYAWVKNGQSIHWTQHYVVERMKPEDNGSYTCSATNIVGTGESAPFVIEVQYVPRETNIYIKEDKKEVRLVKVDEPLTFYCITAANPDPWKYSWYRYTNKQIDSSQWKSMTTTGNELRLERVQRADEACYRCNATNSIGTGEDSEPLCIQVLYAPTKPILTIDTGVGEDLLITITCSVESFPLSNLILRRTSKSNSLSSEWPFNQPDIGRHSNSLNYTFNVTSAHTGFYTCDAKNKEGSKRSAEMELKYRPKGVTVQAKPALVVNESQSLMLLCNAQAHPPVTSVTWMKMTDGKSEIIRQNQTFTLKSVSPSDRGQYSCTASNNLGTGKSRQAHLEVNYAPKHTKVTRVAEQQQADGTSSVTLSCSSHSYPHITQYSWYKKTPEEIDEKVSDHQNYTVYSDQPGVYYCTAKNKIYHRSSDPIHLFEQSMIKTVFIILFIIILLIICLIVFVYRHKKKSSQRGTTGSLPCCGFLGCWNGARRKNLNNAGMAEPFRSTDELQPDQPRRPNGQRCQPRPDSTPASNNSTVYCTVNLPSGTQGPSAQQPIRKQGGHMQDDSLNYASLHFGNKQKNKLAKAEDDVYTMVTKKKQPEQTEEKQGDYENVTEAPEVRSPNPPNYDTDTSEEEFEITYSKVSFEAKPGHQRARRDSSSSGEGETQYSQVKI